jgi:beta-glucanase (GH16 family)
MQLTTSLGDIHGEDDGRGRSQFPILTRNRNSYAEWEVLVKMMLKAHGLWKAVSTGTEDEEDDQLVMEAVPAEYRIVLVSKDTMKDVWDTLKVMRLGNERARKVKEH